jgi:hypothetical protein
MNNSSRHRQQHDSRTASESLPPDSVRRPTKRKEDYMSKIRRNASRLVRASLLIAPALVAVAAPVSAQKLVSKGPVPADPIMLEAEWNVGHNQFVIDSNQDSELIRFKSPHNLQLCAGAAHRDADGSLDRSYPLKVTYDGQTTIVAPASCSTFRAQRIRVAAASPLPGNTVLEGSIRDMDQPAG